MHSEEMDKEQPNKDDTVGEAAKPTNMVHDFIDLTPDMDSSKKEETTKNTAEDTLLFIDPDYGSSQSSAASAAGANIRKLQETWSAQGPIGVKETRSNSVASPKPIKMSPSTASSEGGWNNKANRKALPGLVNVAPPSPPITPPLDVRSERKQEAPPSPRHSRIPSTGSRPTVMDVAQAFGGMSQPTPSTPAAQFRAPPTPSVTSNVEATAEHKQDEYDPNDPGGWEKTVTPASVNAERRRSTYEKYSNFVMPVLKEEKTPAPSPANTLSKSDVSKITAEQEDARQRRFGA